MHRWMSTTLLRSSSAGGWRRSVPTLSHNGAAGQYMGDDRTTWSTTVSSRTGSVAFFSSPSSPGSSQWLRRAPAKEESADTSSRRPWRTHAVSLELGEYPDMEDDDDIDAIRSRDLMEVDDGDFAASEKPGKTWHEEEMDLAQQVKALQDETDEQKKRWLENAKPPVRKPVIDELGRAYGRGGRKTASARVWIQPGLGHVVVNRQDLTDYFQRTTDRELVLAPLAATATCGKFDVTAMVMGGGLTGQAGAIRHGLARALNHYNPDVYRPPLKRLGYLTRDPRKVERKKVGHIKARKKPQWVKR